MYSRRLRRYIRRMGQLTERDIAALRAAQRIGADETVLIEGDVIIAVSRVNGARRVVDVSNLMLEGTKRLLLD